MPLSQKPIVYIPVTSPTNDCVNGMCPHRPLVIVGANGHVHRRSFNLSRILFIKSNKPSSAFQLEDYTLLIMRMN